MKAWGLMLAAVGRMERFSYTVPEVEKGEVLVRVKACGICGSDLHYFSHGGLGSHKSPLPLSLGHEVAGIVEACPSLAFAVGDRVAVDPNGYCRTCLPCQTGRFNLCAHPRFLGAVPTGGSLRELIVVQEHQVFSVSPNFHFTELAMLEPFSVGIHAVRLGRVRMGQTVAVVGMGAIGRCVAKAARLAGAARVLVADRLAYRVKLAMSAGDADDYWVDPEMPAPADVVIDCAGTPESWEASLAVAGLGAWVVLVGIPNVDTLTYNPHQARIRELTVVHARRSNQTFRSGLDFLQAGRVDLEELVTHTTGLGEAQQAFETAAGYRDGVLRYVVDPSR